MAPDRNAQDSPAGGPHGRPDADPSAEPIDIESGAAWRLAALGALALGIMAPVTMPVPVLRELVQERFAVSELLTSLFMSVNMVGGLITAPLAGAVADRFGRRRWLLVGALAVDALCFFALTTAERFPAFLAIRFLEGCAHITALSVLLTLASHIFPAVRRGRAMGFVGGSMMLGIALGAPLGGVLGRGGPLVPLQVGMGILAAAAVVATFATREITSRDARPGFRDIAAALRAHPAILAPLAFAFTDRFTVGFFTTTFALYLRRIHDLPSTQIGLLIAAFMLPFALFSYPFGRLAEHRSKVALLCVGSVLYGIGTGGVGFAAPPALYVLMGATGVAAAVMFVPSMLMTIQATPESIRATALGAFNAAGSLGFIAGPIAGGAISQLVAARADWLAGYRAAFLTAGLSELLCVAVALPILLRLRSGPSR
jgi:MFS family permease